jgi:hypothetical protein
MNDPTNPVPGDLSIDATELNAVDITPDEILRLLKFRDGVAKALANIERLKPEEMARAGINEKEVARARGLIAEYRRCETFHPAAEKLVELVHETKLDRAHQLCMIMGEIGHQARRRAAKDPKGAEILGPLADLLEYQYGPANRAAATRAKAAMADGTPVEEAPADADAMLNR